MIEDHIPYVKRRVAWWSARWPGRAEDFLSAAYLKLVEVYPKIQENETPEAYLYTAINNAILDFLSKDSLIAVPAKKRRAGLSIEYDVFIDAVGAGAAEQAEFDELLAAICETYQDRAIFELIMKGYSYREIGQILAIGLATINRTLRRARKRAKNYVKA